MHRPPPPSLPAEAGLRSQVARTPPRPPREPRGKSQGHADAVVFQLARQDPLVELVEVDKLDQVREFGVPIIEAEEHLPVILALRDTRTLAGLEATPQRQNREPGQHGLGLPAVRLLTDACAACRAS